MDGVKPVHTDGARRVADALLRWSCRRGDGDLHKTYMRGLREQLEGYIDAMDEYMEEVGSEHGQGEPAQRVAEDPQQRTA